MPGKAPPAPGLCHKALKQEECEDENPGIKMHLFFIVKNACPPAAGPTPLQYLLSI